MLKRNFLSTIILIYLLVFIGCQINISIVFAAPNLQNAFNVFNAAISRTRKKSLESTDLDSFVIDNYSTDEIKENINKLDSNEQLKLVNKLLICYERLIGCYFITSFITLFISSPLHDLKYYLTQC